MKQSSASVARFWQSLPEIHLVLDTAAQLGMLHTRLASLTLAHSKRGELVLDLASTQRHSSAADTCSICQCMP